MSRCMNKAGVYDREEGIDPHRILIQVTIGQQVELASV